MDILYTELDIFCEENGINIVSDEPLSKHTTFKIGGNAERFVTVNKRDELQILLKFLKENRLPYFVIGKGSNILCSDEGYKGIIIKLNGEFNEIHLLEDGKTIRCGAGASLASLCSFARDRELTGLEFAWGIPGSVGGAAFMNAGAYGGEMKDVLQTAHYLNSDGSKGILRSEDLDLSYRHSAFTDTDRIITSVKLKLEHGNPLEISAKMDELMSKRREKQPVEFPSAGSTFKRPEGYFAAALIEECGLKGRHVGDAEVSTKHSGFIINKGKASAADVAELIEIVKEEVYQQRGVELECEVIMLG